MTADRASTILAERLGSGIAPGIVSAYLFGSVAEDRSHRESDVDVGVLLDRERHPTARDRFEQRVLLSSRLGAFDGRTVDVVILNDAPPTLGRHVITRGRRVFCTNPELDHVFVRDVQIRAADLDPWLRRMREIKLRAISRP